MSTVTTELKEPIIFDKRVNIPYKHSVGATTSKFFHALNEKKILAVKCPSCNKVIVPPQAVCPACFGKPDEWIELEGPGTLLTYTIVNYPSVVHPIDSPFAYGVIQLDGADTGLVHFLGEVDFENIKIGMRVKAVFSEQPKSNILSIKYFCPL